MQDERLQAPAARAAADHLDRLRHRHQDPKVNSIGASLFYALAAADTASLVEALETTKPRPATAQWGLFLRNHDELNLGRLDEAQRQRVFEAFGPEKSMQLYDRGIRRRLAPMLDGDRRRLELAYSLLFTLPGTPVIRYGDEIGMGDDLSLPERNWTERMIHMRKEVPEIGWGDFRILPTKDAAVLAIRYNWRNNGVLCVHSFAGIPREIVLRPGDDGDCLVNLLTDDHSQGDGKGNHQILLEAYGYRWYRVGGLDYILTRAAA
jgi:maltose alpha-D-glucosyltransferase/alpha-amylase